MVRVGYERRAGVVVRHPHHRRVRSTSNTRPGHSLRGRQRQLVELQGAELGRNAVLAWWRRHVPETIGGGYREPLLVVQARIEEGAGRAMHLEVGYEGV